MTPTTSLPFRFDARRHVYTAVDTGEELPSITQMLATTGWVNDEFYTAASRDRGTAVHRLTASFDLGALDPVRCTSPYRGWLLAHVAAMGVLRPEILSVEEPAVSPVYRFGGRPDREWRYAGLVSIGELKSGDPEKAHPIQTALQAILVAPKYGIPAHAIGRFGVYLKESGRFKVLQFHERRDFDEAHRILRQCCACSGA